MNIKLYINNENKWIATDRNYKKVLLSNKSLDVLQKEIRRINIKDAIIMFVPPFNKTLAPTCL
ncbi:MAG: hypothetical protein WD992_00410 [Candidatus Levyibacteriota bacterium]